MSVSPSRRERKARESNPHLPWGRSTLAEWPGEPVSGYLPMSIHSSGRRGSRTLTPLRDPPFQCGPATPIRLPSVLVGHHSNGVVSRRHHWNGVPQLQWTHRESNPDLRPARPASSRWTISPFEWSAGESNPDFPRARRASSHWTRAPRVIPDGLEPSFTGCEPAVLAAGPRDQMFTNHHSPSSQGGSRFHKRPPLERTALPVCVPDRRQSSRSDLNRRVPVSQTGR